MIFSCKDAYECCSKTPRQHKVLLSGANEEWWREGFWQASCSSARCGYHMEQTPWTRGGLMKGQAVPSRIWQQRWISITCDGVARTQGQRPWADNVSKSDSCAPVRSSSKRDSIYSSTRCHNGCGSWLCLMVGGGGSLCSMQFFHSRVVVGAKICQPWLSASKICQPSFSGSG